RVRRAARRNHRAPLDPRQSRCDADRSGGTGSVTDVALERCHAHLSRTVAEHLVDGEDLRCVALLRPGGVCVYRINSVVPEPGLDYGAAHSIRLPHPRRMRRRRMERLGKVCIAADDAEDPRPPRLSSPAGLEYEPRRPLAIGYP